MQTVDLGKSGIQTSRLAIGTGSNGWNYKSILNPSLPGNMQMQTCYRLGSR